MLQFQQHLFRMCFCTNDVMFRALWRHLISLPCQFSIFEDVGGWQPFPKAGFHCITVSVSDKNCGAYQQPSIISRFISIKCYEIWTEKDKKKWDLVRKGVSVVSGLFSRSCSLGSLFLWLQRQLLGVCLVLLPDCTRRHLRVVIYY